MKEYICIESPNEVEGGLLVREQELIRCKECKYRDPEDKKCDCGHSIQWNLPRSDEWFCADAERRGEGWKK